MTESCLFQMQFWLRARRSWASNIDFFSSLFYTKEHCYKIVPEFVDIFLQIAVPLLIFTSERLHLSKMLFFIPCHVTDLLPVNLIICRMFLQQFLLTFQTICFPVPTSLRHVAAIYFKRNQIKRKNSSFFMK